MKFTPPTRNTMPSLVPKANTRRPGSPSAPWLIPWHGTIRGFLSATRALKMSLIRAVSTKMSCHHDVSMHALPPSDTCRLPTRDDWKTNNNTAVLIRPCLRIQVSRTMLQWGIVGQNEIPRHPNGKGKSEAVLTMGTVVGRGVHRL